MLNGIINIFLDFLDELKTGTEFVLGHGRSAGASHRQNDLLHTLDDFSCDL